MAFDIVVRAVADRPRMAAGRVPVVGASSRPAVDMQELAPQVGMQEPGRLADSPRSQISVALDSWLVAGVAILDYCRLVAVFRS